MFQGTAGSTLIDKGEQTVTDVGRSNGTSGTPVGSPIADLGTLLEGSPRNWGRWGEDDEIGCLNYITSEHVVQAAGLVRQGKVFTLQLRMADPAGDPVWPGRTGAQHFMVNDKSHYDVGVSQVYEGGAQYADDFLTCFLQGSTQYDALGHVWHEDTLWNGYPASSTVGGLRRASIEAIAARGVVGRAVLLDIARHRGKKRLDPGETITHETLDACAIEQEVNISPGDILLVHTGWLPSAAQSLKNISTEELLEPGLQYSRELVHWFADHQIANLVTDTMGNEITRDPATGAMLTLHVALMRNLGIVFTEMACLEQLAMDCLTDKQYEMLYVAAPLKVVGGTGAPVNPVVIK